MDLPTLSDQQLEERLRALQRSSGQALPELEAILHEMQVQRCELEVQNRSLRELQQELENSLRRYSDLYDHLPLGYVLVTSQGQIVNANPAAMRLLEPAGRLLNGKPFSGFLDAYDAGRFSIHLQGCVQKGTGGTIDLMLRLPGGAARAVQLASRAGPIVPDSPRLVHIAITDITQLKRTQRVLEEINREQEAFNYSISHDLRAPLVTISNYARIVLTDHAKQLDDEARGMVNRIESAAMRMEATLENLLEYSMLAREEVVLQDVNVAEVVRDLLIEHRGVIQEKRAEIFVSPTLPTVRGSRVILNQVLANLLTNALKYTDTGRTPRVHFGSEVVDNRVRLRIADEGIGIEPKHHERIFQIFERVHGYTRYPGSGVGLAIARRAVERMNGRIWVESEPGKGSCFWIELPKG